jgi:hypothetical protein
MFSLPGLPKGPNGNTLLFSKTPTQVQQARIDEVIDPKEDEDLSELLEGYVLEKPDKPPLEFPLLVRIDQYKKESDEANPALKKQYEDAYPRKYVSMFILNTPKGKIVSPTLNALMDKFDQQQLKMKDKDNLKIKHAVYANDKVREFEYLKDIKKSDRTPVQRDRFRILRQTLRDVNPPLEDESEGNEESASEKPEQNLEDLAFLKEEAAKLQKQLEARGKKLREAKEHELEETRRLTSKLPPGWEEFTNPRTKQTTYYHTNGRETAYLPTANTPTQALPPGWKENLDPDSNRIFYSHVDGTGTTWTFPTAAATAAAAAATATALPPGWAEVLDKATGKTYYHHASNDKVQWEFPNSTSGGKYRRRTRHRRARNNKTRRNKRNKRKSKSNKNKRNKTRKH